MIVNKPTPIPEQIKPLMDQLLAQLPEITAQETAEAARWEGAK